tara:strand:- start:204 stop:638 length:435 start_codon:yes stop_codon:yes gene_type:complete
MPITLTCNYKDVYDSIVTDQIDEWVEDGTYELRDVLEYLDTYGQENFSYYEEYQAELDEMFGDDKREALDEYLDDVGGPEHVQDAADCYCGQWDDPADFAKEEAENLFDTGDVPSWIEIDWNATWENLSWDYMITDSGHIFRNI